MSVILVTANFIFRNCYTCSKEPMKRAGKVCGDSQDLKSPGDSTDQAVLQWSYTVQILHGGPREGCVLSFQLEKKKPFSSKVDVKIYCSILKVS